MSQEPATEPVQPVGTTVSEVDIIGTLNVYQSSLRLVETAYLPSCDGVTALDVSVPVSTSASVANSTLPAALVVAASTQAVKLAPVRSTLATGILLLVISTNFTSSPALSL